MNKNIQAIFFCIILSLLSSSCFHSQSEVKFILIKTENNNIGFGYKNVDILVTNFDRKTSLVKIDSFIKINFDSSIRNEYRQFSIILYKEDEFLNENYLNNQFFINPKILPYESIIYTYNWYDYGKTFVKEELVNGKLLPLPGQDSLKIEIEEIRPNN